MSMAIYCPVWSTLDLSVVEREEEFMLRKKHDPRGELFGREPEPVVSGQWTVDSVQPYQDSQRSRSNNWSRPLSLCLTEM